MDLLYSWMAAEFLYNDVLNHWGKPHLIWIANKPEFAGSFAQLCKGLGIVQHHTTIGNRKANGQVERTIWKLKDYIW